MADVGHQSFCLDASRGGTTCYVTAVVDSGTFIHFTSGAMYRRSVLSLFALVSGFVIGAVDGDNGPTAVYTADESTQHWQSILSNPSTPDQISGRQFYI